jgi:fatty acid desaturase
MDISSNLSNIKKSVPSYLLEKPSLEKLIIHSISDWILILVSVSVYLNVENIYAMGFSILIASTRIHAFGVILHDVSHMSLKNKDYKMRLIEFLTGYPSGTTVNAMKYHHIRHHQNTCMDVDPYFKKSIVSTWLKKVYTLKTCILIPFWHLRPLLGIPAYYLPGLRTAYARVFLQDKSENTVFEHSKEVMTCCYEDHYQLIYTLSLAYLLNSTNLISFYLISVAFTGITAGYRLMKEHQHELVQSRDIQTVLENTNDHGLKGLVRFFLAPRNIGYHKVHHLHPQVAWYNLPKLRKWYVDKLKDSY